MAQGQRVIISNFWHQLPSSRIKLITIFYEKYVDYIKLHNMSLNYTAAARDNCVIYKSRLSYYTMLFFISDVKITIAMTFKLYTDTKSKVKILIMVA